MAIATIALLTLIATRPHLSWVQFLDRRFSLPQQCDKATVLKELGPPDDVWTASDPAPFGDEALAQPVWAYGTKGHLTFPTLGTISFDEDGKAQLPWGRKPGLDQPGAWSDQ